MAWLVAIIVIAGVGNGLGYWWHTIGYRVFAPVNRSPQAVSENGNVQGGRDA